MSELTSSQEIKETIDQFEAALTEYPAVDCPVVHRFTPGLYIRQTTVPAGTMFTSAEHKTEHPFVLTEGELEVISENEGAVFYKAPLHGVTKAGTRRMIRAITDVVWTTYHVTQETDLDKIAEDIIAPHSNPLLQNHIAQWRISNNKIEQIQ
jgi:hypothetical protein